MFCEKIVPLLQLRNVPQICSLIYIGLAMNLCCLGVHVVLVLGEEILCISRKKHLALAERSIRHTQLISFSEDGETGGYYIQCTYM